jgi:hypothetical protein
MQGLFFLSMPPRPVLIAATSLVPWMSIYMPESNASHLVHKCTRTRSDSHPSNRVVSCEESSRMGRRILPLSEAPCIRRMIFETASSALCPETTADLHPSP